MWYMNCNTRICGVALYERQNNRNKKRYVCDASLTNPSLLEMYHLHHGGVNSLSLSLFHCANINTSWRFYLSRQTPGLVGRNCVAFVISTAFYCLTRSSLAECETSGGETFPSAAKSLWETPKEKRHSS